jgi:hypothetical protein
LEPVAFFVITSLLKEEISQHFIENGLKFHYQVPLGSKFSLFVSEKIIQSGAIQVNSGALSGRGSLNPRGRWLVDIHELNYGLSSIVNGKLSPRIGILGQNFRSGHQLRH